MTPEPVETVESTTEPMGDEATYSLRITKRAYDVLDQVRDRIASRPGETGKRTKMDAVSLLIIEEYERPQLNPRAQRLMEQFTRLICGDGISLDRLESTLNSQELFRDDRSK